MTLDINFPWYPLTAALSLIVSAVLAIAASVVRQLEARATHDHLTGAYNREWFEQQFDVNCQGLLFIDLDLFKGINDTYGHRIGDVVLCEIVRRLQVISPLVVRNGGDEFLILSREGDRAALELLAQQVLDAINQPIISPDGCFSVGAAIGIADAAAGDLRQMREAADLAMYVAKKDRLGPRIIYWSSEILQRARRRASGTLELQRATADEAFELRYQPIIDLQSGHAVGSEALIRWPRPPESLGRVTPDEFVGWAEMSLLICDIGQWVQKTAISVAADLSSLHPSYWISINISPLELCRPQFIERLQACLAQYNCPPHAIALELTESAVIEQIDSVLPILDKLHKQLQIVWAIDDFGTRESGYGRLRDLRPDKLKIDKSLMFRTPDDAAGIAIMRSIIALSAALNIDCVAEGIEHEFQATALKEMGCGFGQGYFFSVPLELPALMQQIPPAQ